MAEIIKIETRTIALAREIIKMIRNSGIPPAEAAKMLGVNFIALVDVMHAQHQRSEANETMYGMMDALQHVIKKYNPGTQF